MITYTYNGSTQQNMTIQAIVALAQANQGGPKPRCRQPESVHVMQGKGAIVPLDGSTTRFVAWPLFTCATVIFASEAAANAYIYHAFSGEVPQATFTAAMRALGNVPLAGVFVFYTFPNPSDENYFKDANAIAAYGIPEANIIYAPDLFEGAFGITSKGILG